MKNIKKTKNIRIALIALILFPALGFLISCGDENTFPDIVRDPSENHAQLRFYHFGINGPSINFFADQIKITAIQSNTEEEAANGVGFGGTHPSDGSYSEVEPGTNILIEGVTPKNLIIPSNNIQNYEAAKIASSLIIPKLEKQKRYSVFTCGVWDSDNHKMDSFFIEDDLPPSDTSKVFIRFVNSGVESAGPLKVIAIPADTLRSEVLISDGVEYQKASPFVGMPYGTYEFEVLDINSGKVIKRSIRFISDKVHTLAMRGDINVASPAPFIDNTRNR